MQRRRFDHLTVEISLAVDRNLPRYPLWLALKELGLEPEGLTREAAARFSFLLAIPLISLAGGYKTLQLITTEGPPIDWGVLITAIALSAVALGVVSGFGPRSYRYGLLALIDHLEAS